MPQELFVLVDCNSFYTSCERVFDPSLEGKPVVVLSNNDGCAISVSSEAKTLNIDLQAPYYKFKQRAIEEGVKILSSNYSLYGDLSCRVMEILEELCDELEVYSIDEAFLIFRNTDPKELTNICRDIKETIARYTGLPVSVGSGATRTIAKLANHYAKKRGEFKGVAGFAELDAKELIGYYSITGVKEVWGIGRRNGEKLKANGVFTVKDLIKLENVVIRDIMGGVTGLRTVEELRGLSCINNIGLSADKKGILSSRSFGRKTANIKDLEEALATYMGIAAFKLRNQKSVTGIIGVYITTGSHSKRGKGIYRKWSTSSLPHPTAYTPELIAHGRLILQGMYKRGYYYKKLGVMLLDLIPAGVSQKKLFQEPGERVNKNMELVEAVDKINLKWKNNLIYPASEGIRKEWSMKRDMLSKGFTTNWKEILTVKI